MDASGDSSDLVGNLRRQHSEEENYDVQAKKQKFDVTVAEISNKLQSSSESSSEVNKPSIQAEEIDEDILKYEELVSQLEILLTELLKESSKENNECVQKWNDGLNELKKEEYDSNVIIGVIGKTRHGKSSLINALLGPCEVLPESDTQSCTAVVVQVEKNKKSDFFEAEIEFIDKKEWDDELSVLKDDYENGKEDRLNPESVAGMAYSKLKGVYGYFERLEDISNEVTVLSSLGKTETVTSHSSSDLQVRIEKYIRALSEDGNQYWPIVKKVTIKIPGTDSDIILNGCTLVDLPGYGDDNAARVNRTDDFITNCSEFLLVSEISEALSSKYMRLDGRFGEQVLKDIMESNLVFICTKNDGEVKTNVLERELRNQKEEEAANELQKNIEHLLSTEKDKKKLSLEKNLVGINSRASWIKKRIKKMYREFVEKWKRKDTRLAKISLPEISEPAIFCVSSREYLKIKQEGCSQIFSEENETEIPQLKSHINHLVMNKKRTAKHGKIRKAYDFITDVAFYFQNGSFQNNSDEIKECVKQSVLRLMEDMKATADTLYQDVVKEMSDITLNLEGGRKQSEREAIRTCNKWPIQYHRKTYFAAMRRKGIYCSDAIGDINFNADLIKPFISSMNGVWSDFFGIRLWMLIEERNRSVIIAVKKAADNLCKDLEKKNVLEKQLCEIKKHLFNSADIELKGMEQKLQCLVYIEQRQISRMCEPFIQKTLEIVYKRVPKNETNLSFTQMQEIMTLELENIKCEMFQAVHNAVIKKLQKLLLTEVYKKICEVWTTSLVFHFQYCFWILSCAGQNVTETKLSKDIYAIQKEITELCEKLHTDKSISSRWDARTQIRTQEIVKDAVGPFNFEKTNDTTQLARDCRLLASASRSVGIIHGLNCHGTGFRIGSCYLATARHLIAPNASTEGTENSEINHDMVTSRNLFVEFEYMVPANNYNGDRYNFAKVCYESKFLDFIILEIKEKDRPLPPCPKFPPCLKISEIVTKNPAYLLGHPDLNPQKLDKIEYYKRDDVFLKKSKEFEHNCGYTGDSYLDMDKKGFTLIHTSFKSGASGAPVIMTDVSSEEPAAVLMFLCGFPRFYYENMERFTKEDKKNFLIVEQCVQLYPLLLDLKKQPEYQALAEDILGEK